MIDERFISAVVQTVGISPDRVRAEAVPAQDFGVDSLRMVSLIVALEDAFGIEWPGDASPLASLGQLSATIDQLLGARAV